MTPRIDTIRRNITATRDLLETVARDLDDLHALAYDRPKGRDRPNVRGGERDYALDRYGDPKARELLRDLATNLDQALEALHDTALAARAFMRVGEVGRRVQVRRVSPTELAGLLAAQERRRARGEYVPNRNYPQPEP
jgi:hypothetical protein